MTDLPFHTLDVFTETPYTGNPLAVVLDAGGLTKRQMQTIAREFNLSETIFVRPPVDPQGNRVWDLTCRDGSCGFRVDGFWGGDRPFGARSPHGHLSCRLR